MATDVLQPLQWTRYPMLLPWYLSYRQNIYFKLDVRTRGTGCSSMVRRFDSMQRKERGGNGNIECVPLFLAILTQAYVCHAISIHTHLCLVMCKISRGGLLCTPSTHFPDDLSKYSPPRSTALLAGSPSATSQSCCNFHESCSPRSFRCQNPSDLRADLASILHGVS